MRYKKEDPTLLEYFIVLAGTAGCVGCVVSFPLALASIALTRYFELPWWMFLPIFVCFSLIWFAISRRK